MKSSYDDSHCSGEGEDPKWAALVNDTLIPMPRRHVSAAVIYEQASVPDGRMLFRDHNSPHDPVIPRDGKVDLADGNVFISRPFCDTTNRPACNAPAKLAFVVNDRWEVVILPHQTGKTVRDLFALPADVELLRDYESPHDQPISDVDAAIFQFGPVFRARKCHISITIIVNGRPKVIENKRELTFAEIVALAFDNPPTGPYVVFTVTYRRGPVVNPEGTMIDGGKVKLKDGMVFNVTATDKS